MKPLLRRVLAIFQRRRLRLGDGWTIRPRVVLVPCPCKCGYVVAGRAWLLVPEKGLTHVVPLSERGGEGRYQSLFRVGVS